MSDPHDRTVTVVTVFCVLIHEGRVLMIRRGRPPYQGARTVPGGHKLHGESLRQACAREMAEETGLLVGELKFAGYMEVVFPGDDRDFLSFYFTCDRYSGELRAEGPEGQVYWAGIAEAPELPTAHPAFRALAPYFLHGRGPFEARAVVDADGRGQYQVTLMGE